MAGYVVDASVAIKWLVDEPLSEAATKLLDDRHTLTAPGLIYAEVANALWAIARRGMISPEDAREALDLFLDAPITIPITMKQLLCAAAKLASDLDHPVYDCLYLALSLHQQRPVVTADKRFYKAVNEHAYLSNHILALDELS